MMFAVWCMILVLVSVDSSSSSESADVTDSTYDIVVVGGGFSGLYTTYRLGQSSAGNLKIALVEKKAADNNFEDSGYSRNGITEINLSTANANSNHACLGGLISDYPFQCKDEGCSEYEDFPDIAWTGACAVRVHTTHGSYFLAKELGIENIDPDQDNNDDHEGSMGHNRGYYFTDAQDLLDEKYSEELDIGAMWDSLMDNINDVCENVDSFISISSYAAHTTGSWNGVEALIADNNGFTGDFAGNDPISLLETYDLWSAADAGWLVYPNGGMSSFIRELYRRIMDNDYADIFCDFEVKGVMSAESNDYKYTVQGPTATDLLHTNKVILTVPIYHLPDIDGIITEISSHVNANVFNPIDTYTCTQQFDEAWYTNKIPTQYWEQSNADDLNDISIDRWSSAHHCMQKMENFNSFAIRNANVIRSLSIDEGRCFEEWQDIIIGSDYDYNGIVADHIKQSHADYFGVSTDDIPDALITHCEKHSHAWTFKSSGAAHKIGNKPHKTVEDWSFKPLESEDIFMCGDGWSTNTGWVETGRAHCDLMMNTVLGVDSEYLPQFDFSLFGRAQCYSICDSTEIDDDCSMPEEAIIPP